MVGYKLSFGVGHEPVLVMHFWWESWVPPCWQLVDHSGIIHHCRISVHVSLDTDIHRHIYRHIHIQYTIRSLQSTIHNVPCPIYHIHPYTYDIYIYIYIHHTRYPRTCTWRVDLDIYTDANMYLCLRPHFYLYLYICIPIHIHDMYV